MLPVYVYAEELETGASGNVKLNNPLSIGSINELLVALLNIVIIIAVPIVVFFIIYSGFLYVTARGNASQVQEATRSLTYSIIGGVLIIGAVAISEIVKNTVDEFRKAEAPTAERLVQQSVIDIS